MLSPTVASLLAILVVLLPGKVLSDTCPCRVTSFRWWDADDDYPITNVDLLDGSQVFERGYERSIEARTSCEDGGEPERVYLELTGPVRETRTERRFPYFAFGDGTVFKPHGRNFSPGSYRLKATPDRLSCGELEIEFEVLPAPTSCPCFSEGDLAALPKQYDRYSCSLNEWYEDTCILDEWTMILSDAQGAINIESVYAWIEYSFDNDKDGPQENTVTFKDHWCQTRVTSCDPGDFPSGPSCERSVVRYLFDDDAVYEECRDLVIQSGWERGMDCFEPPVPEYDGRCLLWQP